MKCALRAVDPAFDASHPARGAWIEIIPNACAARFIAVAPRKGCVD